jgi:hypothetical protein
MNYPAVMSEIETLEAAIAGKSLARYGDGELRVALGRKCISQIANEFLADELKAILARPQEGLIACIPNAFSDTPKRESWLRFATEGYTRLYGMPSYGSSFITRPDSAPWIDTPEYWLRVRELWRDKDIVLVLGDERSLRPEGMADARSIRTVWSKTRDAYAEIDRVEEEIGNPPGPVLMCLGCTATALAARLARKGVHAIDIGHMGMFMRHAGIYGMGLDTVASAEYREQLRRMHATSKWGSKGNRHAGEVEKLIRLAHTWKGGPLEKVTVLDYGCGRGSLAEALKPHRCQQYDPGIPGRDVLPKPSDVVVCTDVLEHVEPDKLESVLDHLARLTARAAYIVIATRPANAVLPDGRNAHLIVETPEWWLERLEQDARWQVMKHTAGTEEQKAFSVTMRKMKA